MCSRLPGLGFKRLKQMPCMLPRHAYFGRLKHVGWQPLTITGDGIICKHCALLLPLTWSSVLLLLLQHMHVLRCTARAVGRLGIAVFGSHFFTVLITRGLMHAYISKIKHWFTLMFV